MPIEAKCNDIKTETISESAIENIIRTNESQFVNCPLEKIKTITVNKIECQNLHLVPFTGSCRIVYSAENGPDKSLDVSIKKVKQPQKFFNELSALYKRLESSGLSRSVTKPYWYDDPLGIVFVGYFNGEALLPQALKKALIFSNKNGKDFDAVFKHVGQWLNKFHYATVTDQYVNLKDIIQPLYRGIEQDGYLSVKEKGFIKEILYDYERAIDTSMGIPLVKTHNDFSLRNIIIDKQGFGIIDWDAMMHPQFPYYAPVYNDLNDFLINVQGMMRIHPLVSKKVIRGFKKSFLEGYLKDNSLINKRDFEYILYVFTLRRFVGIDADRPLHQIYNHRFGGRYIRLLKTALMNGESELT